ncbi:hypothetical protein ABBQ38_015456 [Trebouxia sp. C0009 RCD-2024]
MAQAPAMSAEVNKRTAAEARRQKLLARGPDRLNQIIQGKPKNKPDSTETYVVLESHAKAEPSMAEPESPLLSTDKSVTRSQSLPLQVTKPLESQADEPSSQKEPEPAGRPMQQQPSSPPPNSLWNTPRASDRANMRSESSKAFALPTEEPKHELWAKYDEAAASIFSKSDQPVSIRHISWHQAVAAAVQTTHLLRLLTAVALIMILRVAKSVMYSGKETSSWQQALVHAYDLPPLVLLTLLQLSAIALPAKIYHDSPSTVPQKVMERVRTNADTGAGSFASVIKKAVLIIAPSLLHAQQQLSTARLTTQAVLDGTCVYLFAGMLCHLINVN